MSQAEAAQINLSEIHFTTLTTAQIVALKAEARSFSPTPPTSAQMQEGHFDYASAATLLNQSMREMSEAIPNGQTQRARVFLEQAEFALSKMREALVRMGASIPERAE